VDDGDGQARVSGSTIASPFGAFLTDNLLKTPANAGNIKRGPRSTLG
jgi:hypothetical protein